MATIMGTIEFKMPGNTAINYNRFHDMGEAEIEKITDWINKNHACDYFIMSNTI